jgi:hypothetical protein
VTATETAQKLIEQAKAAKAAADTAAEALQAGQVKVGQLRQARIDAQAATTPDTKKIGQLKKDYALALSELDELDIESKAKAKGADTALQTAAHYRAAHYRELLEALKPEDERIPRELVAAIHHVIDLSNQWDDLNGQGHQLVVASGERIEQNVTNTHSLTPELRRLRHVGGDVTELETALPHMRYRDSRDEDQRLIAAKQAEQAEQQQDRHERAGVGI